MPANCFLTQRLDELFLEQPRPATRRARPDELESGPSVGRSGAALLGYGELDPALLQPGHIRDEADRVGSKIGLAAKGAN